MNALSLAYTNAQKQHIESSWIDDPFNLEGFCTGVASVSHQVALERYIQELIATRAVYRDDYYYLTLDMLSDYEQNELMRLYIETIDREIEWACYGEDESLNSDFLCDMLAMLKNNDEKSRQQFAKTTRKNLLAYYKDTLSDLLLTGCDIYLNAENYEAGYRQAFNLLKQGEL